MNLQKLNIYFRNTGIGSLIGVFIMSSCMVYQKENFTFFDMAIVMLWFGVIFPFLTAMAFELYKIVKEDTPSM